jgi:hypothetical protein
MARVQQFADDRLPWLSRFMFAIRATRPMFDCI